MKHSYLLLIVLILSGCQSTYWNDRSNDAADIFTASVGIGFGVKARTGLFQFALLAQSDVYGLRGGTFPNISAKKESWILPPNVDLQGLVVGAETFNPDGLAAIERHKNFKTESAAFVSYLKQDDISPYYYTQIEAVAAFGPSIRFGFNLGELLDFILGWGQIDIMKDDLYEQPTNTRLQYEIKNNPNKRHDLISEIKKRPLTPFERNCLLDIVWKKGEVHDDEIPILLDFFKDDEYALAGIMNNQNITADQLRQLYEKHKNSTQYSRVLNELATHRLTPDDVLMDMLNNRDKKIVEAVQKRLDKKKKSNKADVSNPALPDR